MARIALRVLLLLLWAILMAACSGSESDSSPDSSAGEYIITGHLLEGRAWYDLPDLDVEVENRLDLPPEIRRTCSEFSEGTAERADCEAAKEAAILEFKGFELAGPGDSCRAYSGDIHAGDDVVIRNQDTTIIALGEISPGVITEYEFDQGRRAQSWRCQFEFEVASVPSATFYQIEIGRFPPITMSFEELQAANWTVDLEFDSY